jgi:hypothetical protein
MQLLAIVLQMLPRRLDKPTTIAAVIRDKQPVSAAQLLITPTHLVTVVVHHASACTAASANTTAARVW